MSNIVINGNAYSDDGSASRDMRGGGHESWLLPMLADTMTEVAAAASSASDAAASASSASDHATNASSYAAALNATSTSSVTIGTGSKTFATQTGKQFAAGGWVIAISQADAGKWITGTVTSYSGGSLVVDSVANGGSGTVNDWAIFVSGARGETGETGAGLPSFSGSDALKAMAINSAGTAAEWQTMPLRNISIFTSGGTFTPDAHNASGKYLVIVVGGGGSGARGSARGGQAGSVIFGVMSISSDQTITIGGGGAAITTDSTAGSAGSDSSIGSLAVAKGGSGGNTAPQASDGTLPGGCICMRGESSVTEAGGSSFLSGALMSISGAKLAGRYGSGGQSAANGTDSGAGGDGICVIIW